MKVYRHDYYPEFNNHGVSFMELVKELNDLKNFYKSRLEDSEKNADEDFLKLVDQMESFLKVYHEHCDYREKYNTLLEKISCESVRKAREGFFSCLDELCSDKEEDYDCE